MAGTAGAGNFCYQRDHVVACTIVVVLFTVFVMGGLTKPVLSLCGIEMGVERVQRQPGSPKPTQTSKRWWKRALLTAERRYLRPVLVAGYERPAACGDDAASRRELDGGAFESTTARIRVTWDFTYNCAGKVS